MEEKKDGDVRRAWCGIQAAIRSAGSASPMEMGRYSWEPGLSGGFRFSREAGARTGIALAALNLALAQPTAPDLWFSPGPQASGKERVV
jgi:hypothetical protein